MCNYQHIIFSKYWFGPNRNLRRKKWAFEFLVFRGDYIRSLARDLQGRIKLPFLAWRKESSWWGRKSSGEGEDGRREGKKGRGGEEGIKGREWKKKWKAGRKREVKSIGKEIKMKNERLGKKIQLVATLYTPGSSGDQLLLTFIEQSKGKSHTLMSPI